MAKYRRPSLIPQVEKSLAGGQTFGFKVRRLFTNVSNPPVRIKRSSLGRLFMDIKPLRKEIAQHLPSDVEREMSPVAATSGGMHSVPFKRLGPNHVKVYAECGIHGKVQYFPFEVRYANMTLNEVLSHVSEAQHHQPAQAHGVSVGITSNGIPFEIRRSDITKGMMAKPNARIPTSADIMEQISRKMKRYLRD